MSQPVDGFSVEITPEGEIQLTLSNRYGEGDVYTFPPQDAMDIGLALAQEGLRARKIQRLLPPPTLPLEEPL